jgi:hypothetical protein
MAQFKQHNCETVRKQNSGMDNFDKYDEIDYSGKSDPDIWETHLEFFFSRQTALRRYAEIKRLHPEAAKKTAVRPFFRPTGEIEIHPDMIKDFTSENPDTAKGVWQFEYWLPSTEKQATEYEDRMSARDPKGWAEHRQREKRQTPEPTAES